MIAILAVLFALAADGFAQCSQCYTAAAQSGGSAAINLGIFVLLTPTLLIFGGVFLFAARRRESDRDETSH